MDEITKLHFEVRDRWQDARAFAESEDLKLKGELVGRVQQLERTLGAVESNMGLLANQIGGLRQALTGEPSEPVASAGRFPAWARDWRIVAGGGIAAGFVIAHSPEIAGSVAKVFLGAG